jgi:type IV secretion system protein VirB1
LGASFSHSNALGGEYVMRRSHIGFALTATLLSASACTAQGTDTRRGNVRLSWAEFSSIAAVCAPDVPLTTLRAIARAESAFRPYALSLDYPERTAKSQGFNHGGIFLARQPRNLAEARAWAHWLLRQGGTVSVGLMQVSSQHAAGLGLTTDQLFDPCTNVRAGAQILKEKYQRAVAVRGEGQQALLHALSDYNSGSPILGFDNGYVSNVVDRESHARRLRR